MGDITDPSLPPEWDSLTPEQKNQWFNEERAFRQALRQSTLPQFTVRRAP